MYESVHSQHDEGKDQNGHKKWQDALHNWGNTKARLSRGWLFQGWEKCRSFSGRDYLPGICSVTCSLTQEDELIQSENSASIFNTLSDIPSQIEDPDVLLQEAMRVAGSLTDVAVETQRCKHLAYLIADQGQLLNSSTTINISKVGLWSLSWLSVLILSSSALPSAFLLPLSITWLWGWWVTILATSSKKSHLPPLCCAFHFPAPFTACYCRVFEDLLCHTSYFVTSWMCLAVKAFLSVCAFSYH